MAIYVNGQKIETNGTAEIVIENDAANVVTGNVIEGDCVMGSKTVVDRVVNATNVYSGGVHTFSNGVHTFSGGTHTTLQAQQIVIKVEGDLTSLHVNQGEVEITGNVKGDVKTNMGNIHVSGNVSGNVKTSMGNVSVGRVGGN